MGQREPLWLCRETVDLLFPLHVMLSPGGEIVGVGPTMARVLPALTLNSDFLEVFTLEKPRRLKTLDDVREMLGRKLIISARLPSGTALQFRCVACEIKDSDNLLIDYSFGENLSEVIKQFHLTTSDFRPNDLSIDMLFMLESQKALLEDSRALAAALSDAKESAETAANIDLVTGIPNRRAFNRHLKELASGPAGEDEHALVHVDLDKFKAVNDTFGHAAGDRILQHAADCLSQAAGPRDLAARIGGDEFAMVLHKPPPNNEIERDLLDVLAKLSSPVRYGEHLCHVSASFGVARFLPPQADPPDQPLVEADIALYEAKEKGKPVVFLTKDMVTRHTQTADIIQDIEHGIATQQFVPFFQPQIDLVTGMVKGVEVLARWQHPTRGILAPGQWLREADRAGLMSSIDGIVMRKAIKVFKDWRADGTPFGMPSFNLTVANLRSVEFTECLVDELLLADIPTSEVQIELLEAILFDAADPTLIEQCFRLHDTGFKLALDDFGTGHASIATLIDMPISVLKIDRSFVTGIDQKPKLQRITKSILAMSNQIGLEVIAEGVETEAELALISDYGCRYVQGYHYAPPLASDMAKSWLEAPARPRKRRVSKRIGSG